MEVRHAKVSDLEIIMKIYKEAAQFMRESGNPNQWINGYPQKELVLQDIEERAGYVIEDGGEIEAVFSFFTGEDPAYLKIDNGYWLNDGEYGTVHRLAASGGKKGMAQACFAWCSSQCPNLKADTHYDNRIMQHLLEKNGFVKCGIIYLMNGDERVAYQKICNDRDTGKVWHSC